MKLSFTICTKCYLPYAKALGDSILRHNADANFYIFIFGSTPNDIDTSLFLPHTIFFVENLEIESFLEMRNRYSNFELCCALKPYISLHLFSSQTKADSILYFDSDILVFNTLDKAYTMLEHSSAIITPHTFSPVEEDGHTPREENIIQTGIYNAGFFGVSNTKAGLHFLEWWKDRLYNKCYARTQDGLFVDQVWLSLAPIYFPNIHILNDQGYNFAYWNFQERSLSIIDGVYMINESTQLTFTHFSGYDIDFPEAISKHQNRFSFDSMPIHKKMFTFYNDLIQKNNFNNLIDSEKTATENISPELTFTNNKNKKRFFFSLFKKRRSIDSN